MAKKKIVHIVEAMLGGIRQHVIDIIENLDPEKFDIYLIYSIRRADKAFFDEINNLGSYAKLILCNEMQREIGIHDINAYKELVRHLRNIKPDIVHCHSSKAGILGRLAAKHCNVNMIIYTPNAYAFETPHISMLKKEVCIRAEKLLSRYATTMTINVSKGEMALAKKYKLDKDDKFELIYNGISDIELPSKEELKRELGLKSGVHYVGATARCAGQKDPISFLVIAEKVVSLRDDVEFIYIGDGELMEEMKKFIKNHRLENKVHLLGFRSDAGRIVGVFDIYLSTALYEGLPYSMIEAMRAGVPIIATDTIGNNNLVIEGENGSTFMIGDIEKAVEAINNQILNDHIKNERVKKTFNKNYSLETMINKLEKLYNLCHRLR